MGDVQALSVSASCLKFEPNDCKVILKPRHDYMPNVFSTPFRAQVFTVLALPNPEDEWGPNLLCPIWVLRVYVEHSSTYGIQSSSKELLVMKQRQIKLDSRHYSPGLSLWRLTVSYWSKGPLHQRNGLLLGWSSGVSIGDICAAASWSFFTRFYNFRHGFCLPNLLNPLCKWRSSSYVDPSLWLGSHNWLMLFISPHFRCSRLGSKSGFVLHLLIAQRYCRCSL